MCRALAQQLLAAHRLTHAALPHARTNRQAKKHNAKLKNRLSGWQEAKKAGGDEPAAVRAAERSQRRMHTGLNVWTMCCQQRAAECGPAAIA